MAKRSRPLGAHFTSPALAAYITRLALDSVGSRPVLQVVDPAVGDGAFLRAAREAGVPETALFGVDVDAGSVAAAASALPAARLRVADALDRTTWRGVPPFDLLLMNPPWISYGNRQSHGLTADRRAGLREAFPFGFSGFPTSHGAFLELASDLVADTGVIGAIVPEQVAHLDGYRGARQALLRRHRLRHIERVGERAFDGVTEPAVILIFAPPTSSGEPALVDGWMERATTRDDAVVGHATPAGQHAVLDRLRHQTPLGELPGVRISDPGVHTGGMAKAIIAREQPAAADERWRPTRRGRDVRQFVVTAPSEWLRIAPPADVPPGVTPPRIQPLERYTRVPILLRQTADRPIAARHASGRPTYFRNSVLACEAPADLIAALVVLLNSAVLAWWHRTTQPDARQKTSPQVKVRHLRVLPCPPVHIDATLRADLAALADPVTEAARTDAAMGDLEAQVDARLREAFGLSTALWTIVREAVEPWPAVRPRRR